MKLLTSLLALTLTTSLIGCGSNFQTAERSSTDDSSSLSAPTVSEPKMASQAMLSDLNEQLAIQTTSKLSASQINAIVASAQMALESANLGKSNDLAAIIPVIIQGATTGVGTLNIADLVKKSNLLALIGDSTLNSLVNLSQDEVSTNLIQTVTSALFANLKLAGVSSGSQATAANTIIQALIGKLSGKDFDVSSLATVIESLAKGSVLGLGKLGNSSTVLQTILSSLGSGSLPGLNQLITQLGSSNNASTTLQNLIAAFTSGSNSGLGAIVGSGSGSSTLAKTLLTALMGGIKIAGATSPTASVVTSIVSSLLGSFLSKI
ncbi:hypothetical protein [Bdellovibrio sp. KM01]|uniref:hypothetical protein n=1 Tax=Bdellovibrio sp. KM01 TaxID=2748865 RepID=UPI0015E8F31B|nr:hypothetical protein [Bdellovibrio sp. KM01]QLY26256.1 hypothetical protein HW988_04290 [Bdellovibrio sp. KM01]